MRSPHSDGRSGDVSLRQLEVFRAIVANGSTLGAARELEISQSAVSRLLTQLEETLGVQLFLREKGRLIPTPEERQLFPLMQDLLERALRLRHSAEEIRRGGARGVALRVAFPNSMTLGILPMLVKDFLALHEETVIEVMTGPYNSIERMIVDADVELGFLRLPIQQSAIDTTAIIETDSVCVMTADHPLAGRGSLTVDDLRHRPLILLGHQRAPRRDVDTAFFEAGIVPRVRVETHSVSAACGFAAQGIGIAIVNRLMAQDFGHLSLVMVPLRPPIRHVFALGFLKTGPLSTTARAFADYSSNWMRQLSGA
ncbi:LysR family transcriptional regulator [Aureimonas populi]|uniref:LysR family transcriptional regulator n=1 Tax=Aureimonas populi TaxID=1701758 RepID=A0ABW5CLK0_9HYPH|nr:LysR family transcriptional regulator [Aureimonas populi]